MLKWGKLFSKNVHTDRLEKKIRQKDNSQYAPQPGPSSNRKQVVYCSLKPNFSLAGLSVYIVIQLGSCSLK